MTLLQQHQASEAALEGQDLFRILQPLGSFGGSTAGIGTGSGDAFEIDATVRGVCIGPESDIHRVKLVYFDPLATRGGFPAPLRPFRLSVGRPLIGRTDARLATSFSNDAGPAFFPPGPVPPTVTTIARIFAFPDVLVDKNFVPAAAGAASVIQSLEPQIDLLSYFRDLPSAVVKRSPRSIDGRIEIAADPSFVVMPFYGRLFGTFTITNLSAVVYTVIIRGHNFTIPASTVQDTVLLAATPIAAGANLVHVVNSQLVGSYDLLSLEIAGAAAIASAEPPPVKFRIEVED